MSDNSLTVVCPQGDLKRALTLLASGVNGKTVLPVLQHVCLRDAGTFATATTTNLTAQLTVALNVQSMIGGEAYTLDLGTLRRVVDMAGGGLIGLEERGALVQGSLFPVAALPVAEFPNAPAITALHKVAAVPTKALLTAITRALPFIETSGTRLQFGCVEIKIAGNRMTLRAVDGFKSCTQVVILPAYALRDVTMLVPLEAVKPLAKALAYKGAASEVDVRYLPAEAPGVSSSNGKQARVQFRAGAVWLDTLLTAGDMPDYDHLLTETPEVSITVGTAAVENAARMLLAMKPYGGFLRLRVEDGHLNMGAVDPYNAKEMWLPVLGATCSGGDILFGATGKYLLDCLAAIGTAAVTLATSRPVEKPSMFGGGTYWESKPCGLRPVPNDDSVLAFFMPVDLSTANR